ncbi:MAG: ubiquinone/menaquinone biosynthesis methyltransferase [Chloroflexota bacterium]
MTERDGNRVPESDVTAMFDDIAPVYDRLNTILTFGADQGWRRAAVEATELRPGDAVADVACGTGKLTSALADRVGPFGRVVGVDLSPVMVAHARDANRDLVQLEFRVGNALALPIDDGDVDAATIAFGLRNLSDWEAGFRELRRVVRPGGRIVCLELTTPWPRWWATLYLGAFRRIAPLVGRAVGRRGAYGYLPHSLEGFPSADRLAEIMRSAGLADVSDRRLGLGGVAMHRGVVAR